MLRSRSLLGILAVLGFIALTATAATAGSGVGGGGFGFTGFVCYTLSGTVDQDRVIDIIGDQFGDRQGVPIGRGRLICTPITGEVVSGNELDLLVDADGNPLEANHQKCYDIPFFTRDSSGRIRLINVNAEVKITDQFDIEVVKAHTPILLCVVANKVPTTPAP